MRRWWGVEMEMRTWMSRFGWRVEELLRCVCDVSEGKFPWIGFLVVSVSVSVGGRV